MNTFLNQLQISFWAYLGFGITYILGLLLNNLKGTILFKELKKYVFFKFQMSIYDFFSPMIP